MKRITTNWGTLIFILFLVTAVLLTTGHAGTGYAATPEEAQAMQSSPDLNKKRAVITINAKRLAVSDYLRAAQNELDAIAQYASLVEGLMAQNDSLRAEIAKLKK